MISDAYIQKESQGMLLELSGLIYKTFNPGLYMTQLVMGELFQIGLNKSWVHQIILNTFNVPVCFSP